MIKKNIKIKLCLITSTFFLHSSLPLFAMEEDPKEKINSIIKAKEEEIEKNEKKIKKKEAITEKLKEEVQALKDSFAALAINNLKTETTSKGLSKSSSDIPPQSIPSATKTPIPINKDPDPSEKKPLTPPAPKKSLSKDKFSEFLHHRNWKESKDGNDHITYNGYHITIYESKYSKGAPEFIADIKIEDAKERLDRLNGNKSIEDAKRAAWDYIKK